MDISYALTLNPLITLLIVPFILKNNLNLQGIITHVSSERIETFSFFVFERTKHQPRRNLHSYLVLQRLCDETALSPGIDVNFFSFSRKILQDLLLFCMFLPTCF